MKKFKVLDNVNLVEISGGRINVKDLIKIGYEVADEASDAVAEIKRDYHRWG